MCRVSWQEGEGEGGVRGVRGEVEKSWGHCVWGEGCMFRKGGIFWEGEGVLVYWAKGRVSIVQVELDVSNACS